jgi:predicted MPP superfamily phosphohydrolase
MRFLVFIGVFLFVIVLIQIYVAKSVSGWLDTFPFSPAKRILLQRVLLGLLIYLNLWIPARFALRHFGLGSHPFFKNIFVMPGTIWLICMFLMFILFALRDLSGWILAQFHRDSVDSGRRAFLQTTGLISIGAPLILTGYGALKTSRDYKIVKVPILLSRLPSGLNGLTIAHISDIHSGPYMEEAEMMKIRELIDSLHPQIVVATGDFVDTRAHEIQPVARIFSRTKNEYGIYGCMGNHDLFDDYSIISRALKESGIRMLENGNQILKINGEELNLIGVADRAAEEEFTGWRSALQGVDPDAFRIVLAHRPSFFPNTIAEKIDLQLSGHTHGGQVALNLLGTKLSISAMTEKYVAGYYKQNDSHLYVNSGVGMVFAPVRISVPPEITLITLQRG